MDFGSWSPSHTILVVFIVVGFVGQVAIYFYRTAQNDKKIDKQSEDIKEMGETFFHALQRLEDRMDKRFVEVINTTNQQISDVRSEISDVRSEIAGVRSEMNQRLSDMQGQIESVRVEIAGVRSEMNQRLSETNAEISDVRSEMSDVRSEMRQLNQNHIEHLNRHHG